MNRTLFISFSVLPHMHTHTHIPPELYVPHSPEPSGTDNQHETPCYPVPPACLQMLQSCQLQPLSNPLTSYMFSPTLNRSTDNNPTRAKQANCQVTRSYMRKIASKNLCAYPICHYDWQGPAELRQGRAELLASAWKVSFQQSGATESSTSFRAQRQGSFGTDSWTDPPTGCLGWKRRVSFIVA